MHPMIPVPVKIETIHDETPDVRTFRVQYRGARPWPGQFFEVSVFGVGEFPVSYATVDGTHLEFSVKKVGAVTAQLFALKPQDIIGIRGPYGTGFPLNSMIGKNITLIGGGIGLPPLRTVIEYILKNKRQYGYIQLLYGARSTRDMVYKNLLQQWHNSIEVTLTIDVKEKGWTGHVGVVTTVFDKIKHRDSIFIIVGPEIMMKYSVLELKKMGVSDENIYLSLERKMKCGVGICGHCNIGRFYICKDGPVFKLSAIRAINEIF